MESKPKKKKESKLKKSLSENLSALMDKVKGILQEENTKIVIAKPNSK